MKPNQKAYEILPTKDCIRYVEKHGLTLKDNNWNFSIPSGSGLIYTLPNGQFVLIPSTSKESYPGIIFTDAKAFKKCVEEDFFPIDPKDMSWLEAHAADIKQFDIHNDFYTSILERDLKISTPLETEKDFESAFLKTVSYFRNKSYSNENKLVIINCLALAIIEYMVKVRGKKWELRKLYEMYNPYYYPIILDDGKKTDVLSCLSTAVGSRSKDAFNFFCSFIGLFKDLNWRR